MNSQLNMNTNIQIVMQQVNLILNSVRNHSKYMSEKSKIKFAKTNILSRIFYGLPCYAGERIQVKNQIHALILKVCRWTKSSYCFKQSIKKICKSIKLETPEQSCSVFTHKILSKRKQNQICAFIRFPRSRGQAQVGLKTKHLGSKFEDLSFSINYLKTMNCKELKI